MTDPNDDSDPPPESLTKTHLWQPEEFESRYTGDDTTSQQSRPAPEASVGHPARIGRYRIERVLGKGAFGTVYRGYDDELKRPVAIKVPHRHLVDKPEDKDLHDFLLKILPPSRKGYLRKMMYTEIATTMEREETGTWLIGGGMTRDDQPLEF